MQEILPILLAGYKHTSQQDECTYLASSEEILSSCLESIKSGTLPLNKASKTFNIPQGTLQDNLKNLQCKAIGTLITFTKYAEELFKKRVDIMCNWCFLLDKLDLWIKKFTNNIPRYNWASAFMKCHNLINRITTSIKRKRAQISKENLREHFGNIKLELKKIPVSNIWNYDKTNLCDDPGSR